MNTKQIPATGILLMIALCLLGTLLFETTAQQNRNESSAPNAHKTLFRDEFHPEAPTKNRIIQYHYLPNKGIKMTLLVDKEDYPKLGIE